MGRFSDAARVREKSELTGKPLIESFLKIAFLYELDQDLKNRDRILGLMVDAGKLQKNIPLEFEKTAFVSLEEANLLDEKALAMPWSVGMKMKIASRLQGERPSLLAKKVLLSEKEGSGPVWSKVILGELEEQFVKTNSIKFYGARSKALFKQRTTAKPILDGADLETRTYILHMLKLTYKNMANEILNTPIPDGLDEKTLTQVTGQISKMADPFDRVNEDYDKLLKEQITAMTDVGFKDRVAKNIEGNVKNYASFIQLNGSEKSGRKSIGSIDHKIANEMRKKLLTDPEDKLTLMGLKEFYTKNENSRLAAYYAGRVENLKQVE